MNVSLSDYLRPDQVYPQFVANSKKRALEQIAQTITNDESEAEHVMDGLQARERLGSTGIGQGIAIPHCRSRIAQTPSVHLFALDTPIEFDSIDGEPVDFLCVLIVPDDANELHLQLLRDVVRSFSDPNARAPLIDAQTQDVLYQTALDLFEKNA